MPWTGEVTYLCGQTDFQMLQLPGYKRQGTAGLSAEAEDMQFLEACDYLAHKSMYMADLKPEKRLPKPPK